MNSLEIGLRAPQDFFYFHFSNCKFYHIIERRLNLFLNIKKTEVKKRNAHQKLVNKQLRSSSDWWNNSSRLPWLSFQSEITTARTSDVKICRCKWSSKKRRLVSVQYQLVAWWILPIFSCTRAKNSRESLTSLLLLITLQAADIYGNKTLMKCYKPGTSCAELNPNVKSKINLFMKVSIVRSNSA